MNYPREMFEEELHKMRKKARDRGDTVMCVLSDTLNKRVVDPKEKHHRMPNTCAAMWKVWEEQGGNVDRIVDKKSRKKFFATKEKRSSSTVVITFATS